MARSQFGGSASDFVFSTYTIGGSPLLRLASATLYAWDAATDGNRLTDLLVDGVAAETITVGDDGQVPTFEGPDGVTTLWLSAGVDSERFRFTSQDEAAIAADRAAAEAARDEALAAVAEVPATTDAAMVDALEAEGSAAAAAVDARAQALVDALKGAAPAAYDTLVEIASKLDADDDVTATILADLADKLDTADVDAVVAAEIDTPGSEVATRLSASYARLKVIDANANGVLADGATDDSAAWQAIVDAAPAGSVITWTGRSMLDDPVVWKTNLSLIGQGWGRSVLATRDTTGTRNFSAIQYLPTDGASVAAPVEDCAFRNFEVDGSGLASTAPHVGSKAFYMQFLRRCQFTNLYLHDTISTALGTDFMPECLIEGVVVERGGRNWDGGTTPGNAGIGIGMGGWEHESVTIANCHAIDCGRWGIFVEWQEGQPYRSKGARIINCTVRGTGGTGIADWGCTETLIQGCHVSDSGNIGLDPYNAGIGLYSSASGTQVLDNTSTDNAGPGVYIDGAAGDHLTVEGNRCGRNERGVQVNAGSGATGHIVRDNELWGSQFDGMQVTTAGGTLYNARIQGNACYNNGLAAVADYNHGIRFDATMDGAVIAGNRCYDNQGTKTQAYGLRFGSGTVTDSHLTGNHLAGNLSGGYRAVGATVTGMTVRNNIGPGAMSENRGMGSILAGSATATIIHGLMAAPTTVVVTPRSNEAAWVTTHGAGGFIVNRASTTAQLDFDWYAVV